MGAAGSGVHREVCKVGGLGADVGGHVWVGYGLQHGCWLELSGLGVGGGKVARGRLKRSCRSSNELKVTGWRGRVSVAGLGWCSGSRCGAAGRCRA